MPGEMRSLERSVKQESCDFSHRKFKGKFASDYTVNIEKGKAYMQGIIVPYLKTDDDFCSECRNGGFGSTDKK